MRAAACWKVRKAVGGDKVERHGVRHTVGWSAVSFEIGVGCIKEVAFEPLLEGRETHVPGSQARVAQAHGEPGWRAGVCRGCRGASRETKLEVGWPDHGALPAAVNSAFTLGERSP